MGHLQSRRYNKWLVADTNAPRLCPLNRDCENSVILQKKFLGSKDLLLSKAVVKICLLSLVSYKHVFPIIIVFLSHVLSPFLTLSIFLSLSLCVSVCLSVCVCLSLYLSLYLSLFLLAQCIIFHCSVAGIAHKFICSELCSAINCWLL